MTNPQQDSDTRDCTLSGALVDQDGNEVPITEDMIQGACEELEPTSLGKADSDATSH